MLKFVLKKIISLIPILVFTTFIVFMVIHQSSGDPATFAIGGPGSPQEIFEWREIHGLNDPTLVQFANYIVGVFRGDFGLSFTRNVNIADEIIQRLPYTLRLGVMALIAPLIVVLPIGILSATKKRSWLDTVTKYTALVGVSVPIFGLGLLLVVFFSLRLGLLPSSSVNYWNSIILPSTTLGIGIALAMIHSVRSLMTDVYRQGYIRTARAAGLSKSALRKHALRNALPPILTAFRAHLGSFFAGIIIVEITFAWPGIGRLFIQGILARDYPMIIGAMFMFILFYVVINIVLDIVMWIADPRERDVQMDRFGDICGTN